LLGADVAASVAYLTALYLVIPYAVALYVRRMYLATVCPLHRKGTKSA
jgi:hypothetical protein